MVPLAVTESGHLAICLKYIAMIYVTYYCIKRINSYHFLALATTSYRIRHHLAILYHWKLQHDCQTLTAAGANHIRLSFRWILSSKSRGFLATGHSKDLHSFCSGLCPCENTLVLLTQLQKQHGKEQLRVISPELVWHKLRRHGLNVMVGGISVSHRSFTIRFRLRSPQPIRDNR